MVLTTAPATVRGRYRCWRSSCYGGAGLLVLTRDVGTADRSRPVCGRQAQGKPELPVLLDVDYFRTVSLDWSSRAWRITLLFLCDCEKESSFRADNVHCGLGI
jgi:hypothetical protein